VQRIRGDLDGNSIRDGRDVRGFTRTVLAPGAAAFWEFCAADMDGNGVVNLLDIDPFVTCLLTGVCLCP
jgi:hypothetical protein